MLQRVDPGRTMYRLRTTPSALPTNNQVGHVLLEMEKVPGPSHSGYLISLAKRIYISPLRIYLMPIGLLVKSDPRWSHVFECIM